MSVSALKPYRVTVNQQGWAFQYLDQYCTEFVSLSKSALGPVADLGCGFGFTSIKLLEAGTTTIANDLCEAHLEDLRNSVSPSVASRLSILPGDIRKLTFDDCSLGGILAARVVHFFGVEEIRKLIQNFFTWLKPGGILCVTCSTLLHFATPTAYAEYLEKKRCGEEWPGKLTRDSIREDLASEMPQDFYGFDAETLFKEVRLAGFTVDKCGLYGTVGFVPGSYNTDSSVGVIARKPEKVTDSQFPIISMCRQHKQ